MILCVLTVTYFPSIYCIHSEMVLFKSLMSTQGKIYRVDSEGGNRPLTPTSISWSECDSEHVRDYKMYCSSKTRCPIATCNLVDVSHCCFGVWDTCWVMGEASNAAPAASLIQGVMLWHCLEVEHHHQLPCLAVGIKPFVTHRLAPMAYGTHELLKGLNPVLLKLPSNERNYLSYILHTIYDI